MTGCSIWPQFQSSFGPQCKALPGAIELQWALEGNVTPGAILVCCGHWAGWETENTSGSSTRTRRMSLVLGPQGIRDHESKTKGLRT